MRTRLLVSIFVVATGCSAADDGQTQPANAAANGQVEPNNASPTEITFSNIEVVEIGASRAVVTFDTSVATSCEAEYGTSADALDLRATDPDMAEGELSVDHEVPLEDLAADAEIFWRARAEAADGTVAYSDVMSFRTAMMDEGPDIPLQNFAVEADVTEVSSNFGGGDNDSTWGISNAFDGAMSTEWATNGDGDDAYVTVDLGQVRKVTHFAFRSREMTDGTSIIQSVQLRFDGADPIGPFETPDPDERYVFQLENAQSAQVITLEAVTTTGGNTGAKEIEFLGTPKE